MHIIGHKPQIEQLRQTVKTGQLASAYLFTGSEGIGKRMVAMQFAMGLFCNPPCETCASCQKIQHGTHADVLIITAEEDKKDISISQMRELQVRLQLHPLEGNYKIVIIDNAEKMTPAAANSILKILEEPPDATHFFLITSRLHMLLPTIISRCQKIQFSQPPLNEVIEHIKKTRNLDNETAILLSNIAGGSIGLAVNFPIEIVKDVTSTMQKIWSKASSTEIISIAERWGNPDSDHSSILSTLLSIYHDIITHKTSEKQNVPNIDAQKSISAIISASRDIEATYNKQLMFEQLLFTLSA